MPAPAFDAEIYSHLRAIAGRIHAERARGVETIAPTELLHEAWAKVAGSDSDFASRAHFMAVAAAAMRQVLIDRARARGRHKRGGGWARVTLTGVADPEDTFDLLALSDAIDRLTAVDPPAADVVVLRAFGGLTVDEVAAVRGVSARSVDRTWRFARAWLREHLGA